MQRIFPKSSRMAVYACRGRRLDDPQSNAEKVIAPADAYVFTSAGALYLQLNRIVFQKVFIECHAIRHRVQIYIFIFRMDRRQLLCRQTNRRKPQNAVANIGQCSCVRTCRQNKGGGRIPREHFGNVHRLAIILAAYRQPLCVI